MNQLRISILQTDIVWENKQDNLRHLHEKLKRLRGKTEIVVLPETFSDVYKRQLRTSKAFAHFAGSEYQST